jgi:integrase
MDRYGRIRESTSYREDEYEKAEHVLIKKLNEIKDAQKLGIRPERVFREAAAKFLVENMHLSTIGDIAITFKQLDPYIGHLLLKSIHDGTLAPFIADWKARGLSHRTINIAIARVRRVLRLAAMKWRDEQNLTWLNAAPLLSMLNERETQREAYPLTWEQQRLLFGELPDYLHRMALFKVNTGCREQEVCRLCWDHEISVPELETTVFLIPWNFGGRRPRSGVKNRCDRLVVLNTTARSVIEGQRGLHPVWVFPHKGQPLSRMLQKAWRQARTRAAEKWRELKGEPAPEGFANVRVHDLKHTFGHRLEAAGVAFSDCQVLLGHQRQPSCGTKVAQNKKPRMAEL